METAVLSLGKEQVAPVRTDARQGGTLVPSSGIIHQLLLAEAMCLHIERAAVEVILYLRIGGPDVLAAHLLRQGHRLTVIEVLAVGRPSGIDLQQGGVVADDLHRIGLHIVEDQVAFQVIDLNLVGIERMEALSRQVGREGNQFLGGMPGRIDTSR